MAAVKASDASVSAVRSSFSPAVDNSPAWVKAVQPFALGGLSGCVATSCIQPIDMIKVRIQLAGEKVVDGRKASKNPFVIGKAIIKNEGFFSLYKGLDAGLIRQITYTTARLGLFRVASDFLKKRQNENAVKNAKGGGTIDEALPLYKKALAGLFAGGVAAYLGNPADLALIRLQSDAVLPVEQRRHYTGVINAMTRIAKEEGVFALWRGASPTVLRAMSLNMGMLASYDQTKEILEKKIGKGKTSTLIASAVSGFFAVTFSLPFDFLKTRIQKMQPDPTTGQMPYKNVLDCACKICKKEGILAFYAGYPTYYARIAPHAMITLIAMDYFTGLVKKYFNN